jgi:hypothetical protein
MGMDPDTDKYMLTGTDRGIDTDMDMNIYIHMHNDTDNDIVWNYCALSWRLDSLCSIKRNGLTPCFLHANLFEREMQAIMF